MHTAFDCIPILDKLASQIEVLVGYDNVILFGTKQGHLWKYHIDYNNDLKLTDTYNNFTKKTLSQLHVDTHHKILIYLSDNMINICDLETFENISTLSKTKGASQFSIDYWLLLNTGTNVTAQLSFCVLIKKRLIFYQWKNKYPVEYSQEATLPEIPKTFIWFKDSIIFATKSEYFTFAINTGLVKELFPAGKNGDPKICAMFLPSSKILLNSYNKIYDHNVKTEKTKQLPSTSTNSYNNNLLISKEIDTLKDNVKINTDANFVHSEMVYFNDPKKNIIAGLCKDEITVLYDISNQQIIHKNVVTWTEAPIYLKFLNPYMIALLPQNIEIRTIQPKLLIQTIPINKAKGVEISSKGIYVWSATTLHLLKPRNFNNQMNELIQIKQFELALRLTDISCLDDLERERAIKNIQYMHAKTLFNQKRYKDSMYLFGRLKIDPTKVLNLYPNMLPSDFDDIISKLDKTSSDNFQETECDSPTSPYDNNQENNNFTMKTQEIDWNNALLALIEYLTEMRVYFFALLNENNGTFIDKASNSEYLKIIDTCLLKCYSKTNDALIGPLLRLPKNFCDTKVCERILKKRGKNEELVILYQRTGLHRKALNTLVSVIDHNLVIDRENDKDEDTARAHNIERLVTYLQRLGPNHIDMILEYSINIIKERPEDALKIFTEDIPEVESLDREKILYFLIKHSPDLIIPYLEYIIDEWEDQNTLFHNALINQYREKVQYEIEYFRTEYLANENALYNISQWNILLNGYSTNYDNKIKNTLNQDNNLKQNGENIIAQDAQQVLIPVKDMHDTDIESIKIMLDDDESTNSLEFYEKQVRMGKSLGKIKHFRRKLRFILEESEYYMPDTLIINFPIRDFNLERAILFGKMSKHESALAIYCHVLNDIPLALKHCHKYYYRNNASNIYFQLFSTLIDPPDLIELKNLPNDTPDFNYSHNNLDEETLEKFNENVRLKPESDFTSALKILLEHYDKIPILKVLEKFPSNIEIGQLYDYIIESLTASYQKINHDQILKGLLYSQDIKCICSLS
ncbi:vam6/Vps39-like protein isoform X3 [Gordionus sp. m RMFG-2023]|uniref:vam6/Vps39-like protein isoform X3 n=1 Tax=Gordionus sp. m RMFG-2023 TaxID=3053472 RepID=UPI0031FBAFE0